MSLVKLLGVSKSFLSGKSRPGRYKMVEQGLLPKFSPVGRPVSLAPRRGTEDFAPTDGSSAKSEQRTFTSDSADATPAQFSLRQACERRSPFKAAVVESGGVAADPRAAVCVNTIPASADWFRLRKKTGSSGARREPPGPVQPELALDLVRPIRNDLSDAEFEIVPARPAPTVVESRPGGARAGSGFDARMPWGRLAARWFGATRWRV
jgi:hypothetical protein